jgi:uracil-DNA glycosylase family 4
VNVAEDQIYERYQAKAIAEINALGHDIGEWLQEAHPGAAPVLGTGHPLADILLLKYAPLPAEAQEGVAFFGRSGQAILKSLQRLRIDPLMLYGTDCVKAAVDPAEPDLEQCRLWLTREIHITQPRMIVAMGEPARAFLDSIEFPLSVPSDGVPGEIQQWTPTIELLPTPDIDDCLDSSKSKQDFWAAFRVLGDWYENLPPY